MRKLHSSPLLSFYRRLTGGYVVLAVFFLLSLGLMGLNKFYPDFFEPLRRTVLRLSTPVLEKFSKPVLWFHKTVQQATDLIKKQEELQTLRAQNMHLLKWQTLGQKLIYENAILRSLLKIAPSPQIHFLTAQVISTSTGPFTPQTLMINAGSTNGVQKDQAVITHQGLVGRILQVGEKTSQVLLIHDIAMRIPAILESTRTRLIVAGNNTHLMEALYLPKDEKVTPGDLVLSSLEGGVFPAHLIIGKVVSVQGPKVKIRSFVKWNRLDFVQVLQQESFKKDLSDAPRHP